MRNVASLFVAAVVLLGASAASADRQPETLDRCGLEFVDCATGPTSKCIVGAVQLDDGCVRGCQHAYDACLRKIGARVDETRPGAQPAPAHIE